MRVTDFYLKFKVLGVSFYQHLKFKVHFECVFVDTIKCNGTNLQRLCLLKLFVLSSKISQSLPLNIVGKTVCHSPFPTSINCNGAMKRIFKNSFPQCFSFIPLYTHIQLIEFRLQTVMRYVYRQKVFSSSEKYSLDISVCCVERFSKPWAAEQNKSGILNNRNLKLKCQWEIGKVFFLCAFQWLRTVTRTVNCHRKWKEEKEKNFN